MLDEDRIVLRADRTPELQRLVIVVREQLRVVLGTPESLDPFRRPPMLVRSTAARDLAVGDVAKKDVLKGVLRVARDRGTAFPAYEVLPLQRAEQRLCAGGVDAGRDSDPADPED